MPTRRVRSTHYLSTLCRIACTAVFACVFLPAANIVAADTPESATAEMMKGVTGRHEEYLEIARAGGVDLLFVGDSITDFWRRGGKAVWAKYFAPLKAANFGVASEGTRNVLWRLESGELDGIHPKLIVLLIGTNNMGEKNNEKIALGVKAIIDAIQARSPGARILLMGIFPRGPKPGSAGREKIVQVNKILATYANPDDPKRVIYMDIGDKFLNEDKTMNKELMPDTLHPSEKGYQIWADAIIDTVRKELQQTDEREIQEDPK